jgi:hypothetical protein
MEVARMKLRQWGIVLWVLIFWAMGVAGVPDALMLGWMHKVTEPGPRSSTDSMIFRTLRLTDGTAKLRALLAGTAPPRTGCTWVVRAKWEDQYEEVAIAISLLAWPDEVRFLIYDDKDGPPKVPTGGRPARIFYMGQGPKEEVPGLRPVGYRMWFKPGNVTP